jgi:hypothetical protein
MSSYLEAMGLLVVVGGGAFKYFVWDFFHMPQTLDERFSARLAEAHAAIHQQKFLPAMVDIYELIASRKALVPPASAIEILTELPIDRKVRETVSAVSERIELDRSYQRAARLCPWVAYPWLISILSFVGLFLARFHAGGDVKDHVLTILFAAAVLSVVTGAGAFCIFVGTRNRLLRLLGANRL